MATKIIGAPETKWIDTTSGIYSSEKSSSVSVTTDFSESLQSPVSVWGGRTAYIEQSNCGNCVCSK